MIINWERGTQIFGGSREIFESEFQEIHKMLLILQLKIERKNYFKNQKNFKVLLSIIKSVICAEILSQELNEFINEIEADKGGKKAKMQQVLICIDNVYRHVERKLNEPLDHSQLQSYSILKS